MKNPKVSIIIPAHNEEDTIRKCIESVLENDYNNKEIVVTNDGSTDRTRQIVKDLIKDNKEIKLLNFDKGHSPAFARNRAVEKSSGDILVFVDADNFLGSKDFIPKLVSAYVKYDADAACWKSLPWNTSLFTKLTSLDLKHYDDKEDVVVLTNDQINKSVLFSFKKDAFINLGKFDENIFFWEDGDLTEKVVLNNYKAIRLNNIVMYSEYPNNLRALLKQGISTGKGIWTIPQKEIRNKLLIFDLVRFILFLIAPLTILFVNRIIFLFYIIFIILLIYGRLITKNKYAKFNKLYFLYIPIYYLKSLFIAYGILRYYKFKPRKDD